MQDWVNPASDQWVTNETLSQELLKKQNRIQTQSQKKIWADTDDHEYLMSQLFIMRMTKIKTAYDMPAAWLLEIIQQMQRRDIFTLQQIWKIKQQCETETEMSRDSRKTVLKLLEH